MGFLKRIWGKVRVAVGKIRAWWRNQRADESLQRKMDRIAGRSMVDKVLRRDFTADQIEMLADFFEGNTRTHEAILETRLGRAATAEEKREDAQFREARTFSLRQWHRVMVHQGIRFKARMLTLALNHEARQLVALWQCDEEAAEHHREDTEQSGLWSLGSDFGPQAGNG